MKFIKSCRFTENAFFVRLACSLNPKKWFLDVQLTFRDIKILSENRLEIDY